MTNAHLLAEIGNDETRKLIIIGGMHGNEHNGPEAMNRVIEKLKAKNYPVRGKIYFVLGNLEALRRNERFIDIDLNRIWSEKFLQNGSEQYDIKELKEIHQLIETICQGNYTNCTLLDLHTFSADSGIFCIPAENKKSEELAHYYGVPFIEKLAKSLPETALNYYGEKGMTSVVFEGGKHHTPEATDNLEKAVWLTLEYLGFIEKKDFPFIEQMKQDLINISEPYPHRLEMVYHHRLEDYHRYKMNEGYYNFKKVEKGEDVARQDGETVRSPFGGFMLMPLYQKKGSDGFFIVQERKSGKN
jgi:succinylglutamate desuccinylase